MAHGGRCMGLNRMVMPTEKLRITPSSSSCHPSSHPELPCRRERPAVRRRERTLGRWHVPLTFHG